MSFFFFFFFLIYDHLGWFEACTCMSFVGYQIPLRLLFPVLTRGPLFMFVVDEENLVTVDQTSHVGTISTWLASYFLV